MNLLLLLPYYSHISLHLWLLYCSYLFLYHSVDSDGSSILLGGLYVGSFALRFGAWKRAYHQHRGKYTVVFPKCLTTCINESSPFAPLLLPHRPPFPSLYGCYIVLILFLYYSVGGVAVVAPRPLPQRVRQP